MKAVIISCFILIVLILPRCKKEKTYNNNSAPVVEILGDAPYSGSWSGTVVEKDSIPSLCNFVEHNWRIFQTWKVKGDSVQIEETIFLTMETLKYNWRGTIKNDTLNIMSSRNINCFGLVSLSEVFITAPITSTADKYNFQTRTIYSMCPPNCIFILNYNMSKTK